jgi:hypothetical protein
MKAWLAIAALCTLGACRSNQNPPLFELLSPRETGIHFANTLQEDDSIINPLHFDYLYNGAGVAVGDLNNDGRPDLYFAGNMVSGKLYLNRGDLKFRDVTEEAGLTTKAWGTGVSAVDINQDGLLDLYLCVAGPGPDARRANLLFVNTGVDADGVPHFVERAKEYGIADTGYSTHAVFFDYDRDGDLDLYVLTNSLEKTSRNMLRPRLMNGEGPSTDRLYRNNSNGTFTNVSREAGITIEGYGLGVAASDLNQDGWPDLYVSNDFISNDLVWINNQDGTFTNRAGQYLKHQPHNGMGTDVADYNNDGRPDIMSVDMLPPDNRRQKLMIGGSNYDVFNMSLYMGYQPQYVRNTLQLNDGPGPDGAPHFSEIGQLAGVHATDWSWAPLFADFDNDGLKDLFISNGYRRDVTNLDYIAYTQASQSLGGGAPEQRRRELFAEMKKLPEVKLHNYLFRNNGDLTFSDESADWGMDDASFSNGAAYADLDGDGDLELVVNNLDGPASLYANRAERLPDHHFLRVALKGPAGNLGGYGARVVARAGGRSQYLEQSPYRGYTSTVGSELHFGLGAARSVDSLEVYWPDGGYQLLTGVAADRLITLDRRAAGPAPAPDGATEPQLLRAAGADHGLEFVHRERVIADFKVTPLLPRKYSQDGPGLAIGDVDGNGLDDVFIGAGRDQPRSIFLQSAPGRFARRPLPGDSTHEDMGALFFDADGDGHTDLYVVSGGSFPAAGPRFYQDRLYLNDGRGGLRLASGALPVDSASGSSVVAADYDRDGDLDLFVGGRIVPGRYPLPARSFLLRNDSRPGAPRFTDVTHAVAPGLEKAGLVTSALWTDFDGDGRVDLILTGEWMPLCFFRNDGGKLVDVTASAGLAGSNGWWNSLVAGDFDGDGDTDYLAGNMGLNSRFKASPTEPVRVQARDFDGNGSLDPVLSYYIQGKSYPVAPRDVMIDQIMTMKGRFPRYADYAAATIDQTFTPEELKDAYLAESYTMRSSLVENLGGGKFALRPLPMPAQFSPAYGMVAADRNGDGKLDVLLVGNSYASDTQLGWYDASVGALLLGDGKGGFTDAGYARSGFFVDGDAKGAAELMIDGRRSLILVAQNNDSLRVFASEHEERRNVRLAPLDAYAVVTLPDGSRRREEFYYGSTYLSQSSRCLEVPANATRAEIYDYAGKKRTVTFPPRKAPDPQGSAAG